MSDCLEVLFVSDSSEKLQTATCFNPHIGTTLMTYKDGGGSAKNCLSIIGNDYLVSANENKPILNVWPLNSQVPSHELRMVLAGKPSALTVSPDGLYCVAGIDGKIYIWLISSGCLLNVVSKHYQAINKIVFTDDSAHFVTAGEDGLVLVWKLSDAVSKQYGDIFKLSRSELQPVYNFSQHSLPVTDVYVGRGNMKARLFTASADQTCKIYCLSSGTFLLSLVFNYVLTSITVNELETELFVGTSCGKIQVFNLDPYPRTLEHHFLEEEAALGTFNGHTKAVTCLSTSFDGVTLASGSKDEKVFLWNISSRQLLRSFEMKGPISNMFFYFASSNIFSNKLKPNLIVNKFEKVSNLEEKNLELNIWTCENLEPILFKNDFEKKKEATDDHVQNVVDKEDVASLKQEVQKLRDVNKQLYQFAMNKILKSPYSINVQNGNDDDDD